MGEFKGWLCNKINETRKGKIIKESELLLNKLVQCVAVVGGLDGDQWHGNAVVGCGMLVSLCVRTCFGGSGMGKLTPKSSLS